MNALMIFLGEFGATQFILIAVVILLLFGGRKIPELMKGLGSGIKEFKNAAKEDNPVSTDPIKPSDPAAPRPSENTDQKVQ